MAPQGALDYNEFTRLIQRELSPAGSEAVPDKVVQKFWRLGMGFTGDVWGGERLDNFYEWGEYVSAIGHR